jgi:hypothetical protein
VCYVRYYIFVMFVSINILLLIAEYKQNVAKKNISMVIHVGGMFNKM